MLSAVLGSDRAVFVSIAIMRAFVEFRALLANHQDLAEKIEALENKYEDHDEEIRVIFDAIKQLLDQKARKPGRAIGFRAAQ